MIAYDGVPSFGQQTIWAADIWATRRLGDILGDTIFMHVVCPFIPLATGDDTSV